ncbi:MAG: DUF2252 domain-containing protein [Curvibacter sp.]|nr:DUF2252 domain-containing protein [Curvibacter sp.]
MSKTPHDADPMIQSIVERNQGRDPERLAMKYAKMRDSAFIFLRGACHLFYEQLPDDPALRQAPLAWSCGDLHFENCGSYKGDNRLPYFDINDFDEAALAPCTWDLLRLLTSIQCGANELAATESEALAVSQDCLDAYRNALLRGKPLWVEAETATGLVGDLFTTLQNRSRAEYLDKRTVRKNGHRQLKVDGVKALAATDDDRAKVHEFVKRYAARQEHPAFFEVIDVARRIAGTGSLGLPRFVVLVQGKGSPDGNYLLDIKMAQSSALAPALERLGIAQPAWPDEASRVVAVQKRMQAVDHAFLYPVTFDGQSCVFKGLQPSEDRVAIAQWGKKLDQLRNVVCTMGRVLAWDQLRASGHAGAANADALIEFAAGSQWGPALIEASTERVKSTEAQWRRFVDSPLGRPQPHGK